MISSFVSFPFTDWNDTRPQITYQISGENTPVSVQRVGFGITSTQDLHCPHPVSESVHVRAAETRTDRQHRGDAAPLPLLETMTTQPLRREETSTKRGGLQARPEHPHRVTPTVVCVSGSALGLHSPGHTESPQGTSQCVSFPCSTNSPVASSVARIKSPLACMAYQPLGTASDASVSFITLFSHVCVFRPIFQIFCCCSGGCRSASNHS